MKQRKNNLKKITMLAAVALFVIYASSFALAGTSEELYKQHCMACHGAAGAGDGPQAGKDGYPSPRPLTQSVSERMVIEKAMLQGVNNVPGHGIAPLLTQEELEALINYTLKLAKPQ